MNPILKAGLVKDNCPQAEYVELVGGDRGLANHIVSRSDLMEFSVCPRRWLYGHEDKETSATEFGSLIDCLVTQPHMFEQNYVVRPDTYPDTKTGEPKKWTMAANWCKDWASRHEGRIILSSEEHQEALTALDRIGNDPDYKALMNDAQCQVLVTGTYHDEDTGIDVLLKGLVDIVPTKDNPTFGKCLADLKTARNAAPGAWERTIWDRNYHVQAAMYLDLYCAATGEDRNTFLHLIIENEPPYEPGRRVMSQEFVELGRLSYVAALKRYCQCLKLNDWPGYETNCLPTLPGWQIAAPQPWMLQNYA